MTGHVPVWDDEHRYIVEGSGEFPFDMLRRDRAFPADIASAKAMGERNGLRRVELITARARDVNVKRWDSFGWRVVAGFIDTYPMVCVDGEPFDPTNERHVTSLDNTDRGRQG